LLSEAELELPLPASACPSFVLPNADARGYYLWSLKERDFDAVLEHLGELSVAERLSALSNAQAAARSGELSIERLLQLALQVGAGEEHESVQAALGVIHSLRDPLLSDAALPAYRSLIVGMVQRRAHALGLFPRRGTEESGETKLLRPLLFGALALEGRDAVALKDLARLGRARLGLGEDARLAELPSELHELALSAAVMTDGAPAMARASRLLADSSDGLERRRLLRSLGANPQPGLTPTVLDLVLTPRALRTNEVLSLLFMQMEMRETRPTAYRWLSEHIDAVVEQLGNDNAGELPELASSFCSASDAAAARAFFEPRVQAWTGGPHNLAQSLEAIELCSAFAARHATEAQSYFLRSKAPVPAK
jgi:alanyl aminopeptidase